jgi:phosphoribosylamine---glycine ligase
MPLLKTPASELFYKASTKQLDTLKVEFHDKYAVGVVMASRNYPYDNSEPSEIIVDETHHDEIAQNTHIAYAGREPKKMGNFTPTADGYLCASG